MLTLEATAVISTVFDEIARLEWAVFHVVRAAQACATLFGTAVSALFADNGVALILTLVVLTKLRCCALALALFSP